jgi:hypothetical protein
MQFSLSGSAAARLFSAGMMCAALAPASGALAMGVPIQLDAVADYDLSIDNSRAANGTISIHTCSKDKHGAPGTNDRVQLTIKGMGGEREIYDLDMPGDDREANRTDTYAFHFPKGSVGELKSFEIEIWGYDTWCIDRVTVKAGGDTLVDYNISGTWLLTNEWGEPGQHSMLFSDVLVDKSLNGKLTPEGLELKRGSAWWMHDIHLSDNWSVSICQLPKTITLAELKKEVETKVGSMISSSGGKYNWGGGGATITVKTSGAHPVYHAAVTFKADVEWKGIQIGKDATVDSDFDIIPDCNPEKGMSFSFTKPTVDVTLSTGTKVIAEIVNAFSASLTGAVLGTPVPWAQYFFPDIPTSGPKIKSLLIDQSFCPEFSVAANKDLQMAWPANLTVDQLNLSDKRKKALGLTGKEVIVVPKNILCIDPDSLEGK